MKFRLYYLFIILLATACSKPVANFLSKSNVSTAPAQFEFTNQSSNAERYEWRVNDSLVSSEKDLSFQFYYSGRQKVELSAFKSNSSHVLSKDIFVNAPLACQVLFKTNKGDMLVELSEETPEHQKNFLEMVSNGFYTGMKFHRVIDGFMIQVGDPNMRKDHFNKKIPALLKNEIHNKFFHVRGALAAARMPDEMNPEKESSSTQFYIVEGRPVNQERLEDIESGKLFDYNEKDFEAYLNHGGAPQLDGEYTIFGHLIIGDEVMDIISNVDTDEKNKPIEDVFIIEAKILN